MERKPVKTVTMEWAQLCITLCDHTIHEVSINSINIENEIFLGHYKLQI